MPARLRVGVVGLGIGTQHAMSYVSLPEQYELAAICDPDVERLGAIEKAARDKQVSPETFGRYEQMLDRCDLDIVDLCTPPHLHFDQTRAALEAGRHVVCEKPLVPSLAELDELGGIAERCQRELMPIFQYRFGSGFQKLLRLIDLGLTGRAYLSTVETAWRRGDAYYAADWRGRWETELGGVLLTHAIHAHDLMCCALGPVESVFARTRTLVNPIETEDTASISLGMADGSLVSLSATLGSTPEISRLRFCFEDVTAESGLAPYTPSFEPWTFTGVDDATQARIDEALVGFDAGPQWYAGQFSRFHDALRSGGPLPVTLADARRALELVTAMYHSSETGDAVTLPIGADHDRYRSWIPGTGSAA